MTALAEGPAPTPAQAKCPTCRQTFGGIRAFDRHRTGGLCADPREMGWLRLDDRGVWRKNDPHPLSRRLSPAPRQGGKGTAENSDHPPLSRDFTEKPAGGLTTDHTDCDYAGKQVRCDRCGARYVCSPLADFYCTPAGDHCCEACLVGGLPVKSYVLVGAPDSPDERICGHDQVVFWSGANWLHPLDMGVCGNPPGVDRDE